MTKLKQAVVEEYDESIVEFIEVFDRYLVLGDTCQEMHDVQIA